MDDKKNIKTSGLKCDRSGWKTVRLGEVGDFFKGHGVTMKDTCVTGVPCTMYGDIYVKYGITFEQVDYYLPAEKAEKAFKGQYGDLLFTASGETAEEIGKCAGYFGNKKSASGEILSFCVLTSVMIVYFFHTCVTLQSAFDKKQQWDKEMLLSISKQIIFRTLVYHYLNQRKNRSESPLHCPQLIPKSQQPRSCSPNTNPSKKRPLNC